MQKGFSLVAIIIGILIVIFVAYLSFRIFGPQVEEDNWVEKGRQTTLKSSLTPVITSQTPQPSATSDVSPVPDDTGETKDWKTYTDTIRGVGFSLKYPQDLFYMEDQKFGPTFFNNTDQDKDQRDMISKFSVTVNDLGRDFDTLYGLPDNTLDSSEKAGIDEQVIKLKNITLGKQKAVQYATVSPNTYTIWTLTKVNNRFIEIYTSLKGAKDNSSFKSTYDQILSTFKFIP